MQQTFDAQGNGQLNTGVTGLAVTGDVSVSGTLTPAILDVTSTTIVGDLPPQSIPTMQATFDEQGTGTLDTGVVGLAVTGDMSVSGTLAPTTLDVTATTITGDLRARYLKMDTGDIIMTGSGPSIRQVLGAETNVSASWKNVAELFSDPFIIADNSTGKTTFEVDNATHTSLRNQLSVISPQVDDPLRNEGLILRTNLDGISMSILANLWEGGDRSYILYTSKYFSGVDSFALFIANIMSSSEFLGIGANISVSYSDPGGTPFVRTEMGLNFTETPGTATSLSFILSDETATALGYTSQPRLSVPLAGSVVIFEIAPPTGSPGPFTLTIDSDVSARPVTFDAGAVSLDITPTKIESSLGGKVDLTLDGAATEHLVVDRLVGKQSAGYERNAVYATDDVGRLILIPRPAEADAHDYYLGHDFTDLAPRFLRPKCNASASMWFNTAGGDADRINCVMSDATIFTPLGTDKLFYSLTNDSQFPSPLWTMPSFGVLRYIGTETLHMKINIVISGNLRSGVGNPIPSTLEFKINVSPGIAYPARGYLTVDALNTWHTYTSLAVSEIAPNSDIFISLRGMVGTYQAMQVSIDVTSLCPI